MQAFYKPTPKLATVGRIINHHHWLRIKAITKGTLLVGGSVDEESLFIAPTAYINIDEDDPMVQTELFAPILPILKYKTVEDAKRLCRKLSGTPLAMYVFSEDTAEVEDFMSSLQAGSVAINDTMAQISPAGLPFGGVGGSGFGAYRGRASIDTFSHLQTVVTVPTVPAFEKMLEWRYSYSEGEETLKLFKTTFEQPLQ